MKPGPHFKRLALTLSEPLGTEAVQGLPAYLPYLVGAGVVIFDPDFRAVGAARYWGLIRLASFTIITQMATNVLVKAKGATMSGFAIGIFVEGDSATIVAVITRNNVSSG